MSGIMHGPSIYLADLPASSRNAKSLGLTRLGFCMRCAERGINANVFKGIPCPKCGAGNAKALAAEWKDQPAEYRILLGGRQIAIVEAESECEALIVRGHFPDEIKVSQTGRPFIDHIAGYPYATLYAERVWAKR